MCTEVELSAANCDSLLKLNYPQRISNRCRNVCFTANLGVAAELELVVANLRFAAKTELFAAN